MQFWIIQSLNSLSLGGLLFLLASGFSLIFGLMRLANLTHGAFFMLGTYLGATTLRAYSGLNLWVAALGAGIAVAILGGLFERLVLTRLKTMAGKPHDKKALIGSIRSSSTDTIRGVVKFDEFGNIIGNAYLRKVTRKDGRLVNSVIKTYPDVSQFWTYDKVAFLKDPVYSRDYPPAKNLEP